MLVFYCWGSHNRIMLVLSCSMLFCCICASVFRAWYVHIPAAWSSGLICCRIKVIDAAMTSGHLTCDQLLPTIQHLGSARWLVWAFGHPSFEL